MSNDRVRWEKNSEGKFTKNELFSSCPNPKCPYKTQDGRPLARLRHDPEQVARCRREFGMSMGDA